MALTPEQREARRSYIGSSDSPAVCGCDPYRTAMDVYLDKTGQAEPFAGNANTDRGTWLEPAILDWAQDQLPVRFCRDVMQVHGGGVLAANFDGLHLGPDVYGDPFIVEAKSSVVADEWGESGTSEVPERVIVQVHHALYVAGPAVRTAWVPVLLPGYRSFDFRMYRVDRDDDLASAVAERATTFMEHHVRGRTPPDDTTASIEVLRRVRRRPNKSVEVDRDVVEAVVLARAARKAAADRCDAAETALLSAMGDAEQATADARTVTYMETKRAGYTVQPTTYRTLRIKAGRQLATANGKESAS